MPDISMCSGGECPQKNKCYRHRANPDHYWQSWFQDPPFTDKGCDSFMPLRTFPEKKGSHYEGEF